MPRHADAVQIDPARQRMVGRRVPLRKPFQHIGKGFRAGKRSSQPSAHHCCVSVRPSQSCATIGIVAAGLPSTYGLAFLEVEEMKWREWLKNWRMVSLKISLPYLEMERAPKDGEGKDLTKLEAENARDL